MPRMSWVRIAESAEVAPGTVRGVDHGAVEVVAWRGARGEVCVMDGRCPHQWSYLGFEGLVDGDELVCASHFWRFDSTGRGTKRNVLGRVDEKADITVYPSREIDGVIEADLPD
jgi:phenylpropionate dioxygenase-like ring-hydroxylating dioxygenase large terminal subunit